MAATFDSQAFHAALDGQRQAMNMTWKDVAVEAGISASTLTRMGQGKHPDADGLAALVAWSGLDIKLFIRSGGVAKKKAEPLAQITAVLRADRNLNEASVEAIEQILKATYKRFRE